jgi:hypothetical protein
MWCRRRMEKISWTDRVRNEEVLYSEEREEYPAYDKKGNCIDDILRRNCLVKQSTE